jgi:uncharacterized protein YggE
VRVRWLLFLLLLPVTTAVAAEQPQTDQNQRIIQMEGRGEVRVPPDRANMSFAIETKGSTAQEASVQNSRIAEKVIAALKSKIGADGKVETGSYSLMPLYGSGYGLGDRIRDFIADNTVRVECDPSVAGAVIDAAHAAGGEGNSSIDDTSGKATMDLQIRASALTASEAIKLSGEQAQRLADAVRPKLAGRGTVKIVPGNVQGEHESNNEQQVIGYQASNTISAQTSAVDQVGGMLDAAIAAGATLTNFVNFDLRDSAKARSEAMADACKDAQLKADAAAKALGLKIKRVMKITNITGSNTSYGGIGAGVASNLTSPGATTPIRPGEIAVPATVSITYELE